MNRDCRFYIFYLLLAFLAYWQVGFLQNALQWDMVDVHFPWRYFIGESLLNGEFPLWNPHQNFGYPIHADMRSIWTPEIWFISLFGGYSIYTFSFLFIFYTALAGVGMMHLARYFLKEDTAAFLVGLVYMLSGYLTAHAQELYTINSFAFIPLVLYQYLKFRDDISLKRASYVVFFVFLLLTSGYQAHSFILFYLLLTLFLYFVIGLIRQKNTPVLKKYLGYHLFFLVMMLLLLLPLMLSAMQVFPYVTRLNSGVDTATIAMYPFSPQSLLSLILPFAVIRDIAYFETDLSMTNLYFGVIALAFALVGLFRIKKDNKFNILLIFGLISLLASFGADTPLRGFLFDYLPFMNLFRGSAYFRLFTLIPLVIASGYLIKDWQKHRKWVLGVAVLLIMILLGFVIKAGTQVDFSSLSFFNSESSLEMIFRTESTFYENIFLQGTWHIILLVALIILMIKFKSKRNYWMTLAVFDLILAVQFNIHSTVVSQFKPSDIHQFVSSTPKGFPIPERLKISECTDKASSHLPLWRNTNMFTKRISGDAFNSFILDKTSYFKDSLPEVLNRVSDNELLYFSNDVRPLSQMNPKQMKAQTLFIEDSLMASYSDLRHQDISANTYQVRSFSPNKIELTASVQSPCFLTLIQTYYPGWEVFVNHQKREIIESNTIFMSVPLEKGEHQIEYRYSNPQLIYAFVFSYGLFFLLLLFILRLQYFKLSHSNKKYFWGALAILLILIAYNQYVYRQSLSVFDRALSPVLEQFEKGKVEMIADSKLILKTQKPLHACNFSGKQHFSDLRQIIEESQKDTLYLCWKNSFVSSKTPAFLQMFYAQKKTLLDTKNSKILMFYGKGKATQKSFKNDFEQGYKAWYVEEKGLEQDSLGNHYFNFDFLEYGCVFSKTLEQSDLQSEVMAVLDVYSQDSSNPLLVFDVLENGKSKHWSASELKNFRARVGEERITFVHHLDLKSIDLKSGVLLKVYIWNRNKEAFQIDNFSVSISND